MSGVMSNIIRIAIWEGYAFAFGLCGAVLLQILTGSIGMRGLIEGRTPGGLKFLSASRAQLVLATLAAAAQYVHLAWQNPQQLPDVSRQWLLLFGGSQALYLGSKFYGRRSRRFHI
jgi:hypothetical protein